MIVFLSCVSSAQQAMVPNQTPGTTANRLAKLNASGKTAIQLGNSNFGAYQNAGQAIYFDDFRESSAGPIGPYGGVVTHCAARDMPRLHWPTKLTPGTVMQ